MTQQAQTGAAIADRADRCERSQGTQIDRQLKMVQDIRREIIDMLAAKKRGFSVDDYYRLADVGILTEDDRVELIDGEIVPMSPIGSRHAACVKMLGTEFAGISDGRYIVSVQDPIRLDDDSEPQPDIALLRPRDDFYAARHPTPEDIFLVIEVADTSLEDDRKKTTDSYAKHAVPEVWIANLTEDCIERFRNPTEDGYSDVSRFGRGEVISPKLLPDVELRVDAILP